MSKRAQPIFSLAVIALSALASIFFGLRSYGSYLLLRSAYEAGRPQVSSLRPWMTLDHVAASYRVPLNELLPRLGLPRGHAAAMKASRRSPTGAACRVSISRAQVQRALGQSAPPPAPADSQSSGGLTDRILSALLIYGYPALALTLLLGRRSALPLPIGVAAVLAGSLAALGNLRWEWAAAIAVIASFAGDIDRLRHRPRRERELPRPPRPLDRLHHRTQGSRAGAAAELGRHDRASSRAR